MALSSDDIFKQAIASFQAGRLNDAERHFKEVLRHQPNHVAALNLLSVLLTRLGRCGEAEPYIKLALKLNSNSDATFYNYGLILKALNRPNEARERFSQALAINATVAETWNNRGTILNEIERYDDAIADFDKAISLQPKFSGAFCNKGKSLGKLKRYDEALTAYDKALTLNPDLAEAWVGRGNVFNELKRYDEAFAAYDKALTLNPDLAEAWLGRGNVFKELKRYDEAFAAYDKALALKPDLAEAWLGRGNVFYDLKRYDEAFAAYDRALALKPDLAEAWLGRGNVFTDLNRYGEAFAAYDKALALKPDLTEAYNNRGVLHQELMQIGNAIADYNKAIEISPNDAEAYWNKSLSVLLSGELEEGWKLFEWRWKIRFNRSSRRHFLQPLWLAGETLTGKSILLYGEQGLGDIIQFCRYGRLIADLGAQVILEVPKPLMRLLANLSGVAQLVEAGSALPPFDYQCPLMSLPLVFKTDLSSIPANIPYIKSEPEKYEYWRAKLGERRKPKIGLVWSGGFRPNQPELWRVNERRNIPLTKLAALRSLDIEYYSLQKGELAKSELAELSSNNWNGPSIIDFGSELMDFSDTAAFVDNLDLVISVDTSTAHLAGAMGKPVWILNRFDTDWRWLLDRTDSPWYPTAKLYRQERAGSWDDVVQRVRHDLLSFCRSGS